MNKPLCILFAGALGSSKTPIANHLSWNLNLPVFNRDAIRTEVREDTLVIEEDPEIFHQRARERLEKLIGMKISFILDSSVDRRYKEIKEWLGKNGYDIYLISIDISKEYLLKLYEAKGYIQSKSELNRFVEEHKKFLDEYSEEVNVVINDGNFLDRLNICLEALKEYIQQTDQRSE